MSSSSCKTFGNFKYIDGCKVGVCTKCNKGKIYLKTSPAYMLEKLENCEECVEEES